MTKITIHEYKKILLFIATPFVLASCCSLSPTLTGNSNGAVHKLAVKRECDANGPPNGFKPLPSECNAFILTEHYCKYDGEGRFTGEGSGLAGICLCASTPMTVSTALHLNGKAIDAGSSCS